MFNPVSIIASELSDNLVETYRECYGGWKPGYGELLASGAKLVMERLGNSNALYHNVEHTLMVTLCGQQIMRGRLLSGNVEPEDWLHFITALLVHDIGYLRGICSGDTEDSFVIGEDGENVSPRRGASDAFLTPYHVERGKIYVRERFSGSKFIDGERLADMIEMTRFPIPQGPEYQAIDSEGALVRAADLIGQMGDPFYHRKSNALFAEFVESGTAASLTYETPADLTDKYPEFFWTHVEPFIGPAVDYLRLTTDGKTWIANMQSNIFQAENGTHHIGPYPG
ncbi:MAG: metal-dependent phosphohydrolase [Rhizobiaceae bacterium]